MSERRPLLRSQSPAGLAKPKATLVPWRQLIVVCLIRVRFARNLTFLLKRLMMILQSVACGTHRIECREFPAM